MSIRKALPIGSSIAVTIPKRILKARNITAGDELRIEEVEQGILIRPLEKEGRSNKITALTLDFVHRYRKDLESLKDK